MCVIKKVNSPWLLPMCPILSTRVFLINFLKASHEGGTGINIMNILVLQMTKLRHKKVK